jgi:ligand-binding sensor domain-containing protein/signal transduction histidine kinase
LRNLNTFRNAGLGRRWIFRWAIGGLAALCFEVSASAIDPNRMMSQYLHESWGTEKGFPGGSVSAIAQTTDGYLWIGTDKGLVRFDGLNFRRFEQANPGSFGIGPIRTLLADPQGNLWILLQNTKLFRYRDGTFELSRGEAENGITAMGQGTADAILLSSLAMGTLTYDGKRFLISSASVPAESASLAHGETFDQRSARLSWSTGVMPDRLAAPTAAVISIAGTTDGKIWLGTQDKGLFYLQKGRVSTAANGLLNMKVNCLLPLENSELWVGTSEGVLHWNGTELTRVGVPSSLLHIGVLSMIRDRESNVWVGTTRGLVRFNVNGISSVASGIPKTAVAVTALFEDREGNIWVGSARGLERLRDSAFVTYSFPGLKSQSTGPLYVDPDNYIWFAPIEGGLRWLKGGKGGDVTATGLTRDIVYSINGIGKNDLWVGRQRGGLTHLLDIHGTITAKTYTQTEGLAQNSVYAVYESRDGTIWSGTLNGGVSELRNGHFTTYTTANGLASNTVSSIAEDTDGAMWFGTSNGLSAMAKSGWRSYSLRDGLPSSDVNCLLQDSNGVLWIGTAEGMAFLRAGHLQVPREVPDSLRAPILGIAEDRNGWLWVATASHVLQVKRSGLIGDVLNESDSRDYGLADGLQGTEGVKRYQSVVSDSQGRVWFSTNGGLSVVNPLRATVNPAPALVHLEAVLVDGNPFELRGPIRVPPGKQRTTFRYVGLSLSNSEGVRYRYKLDSFDRGWSEPVTNREATYSNLGAGSYRFHVMASNGDGLWNGKAATVGFEVEPTLWQTWWFRFACLLCAALATLLVYRLRMHQVTRLLNVRFDERLAERTRIAQDLHDTLLQGVLSTSMQLHVAVDQLPPDSPALPAMNRVLQLMGQVVDEGRNTLRGLRSSMDVANDLESSLSRIPQELDKQAAGFRVVVDGVPLRLRSAIRDDIYRIGREALVNAFRHSGAGNIDLHLEYTAHQLRILVRDDGCGIDPQVLRSGRDGHWGLPGMRERAERIGARVRVLSRAGGGTEVELRVPSNVAFESAPTSLVSRWFARLPRRPSDIKPVPKQRAG